MATAAMATTTSSSSSSSISSTSNGAGSSTSSSNSKILESPSSGYSSNQSLNSSTGLLVGTPRARRGRQSSSIFPCSGPSHYTLSSENSLSTKLSGNQRENGPLSLFKMRGLNWKSFYENSTVLAELNSSDSEDNRKKQSSLNLPHSSSINSSMASENSSQATISKLKRDSNLSSSNLFKMRGLRWKSFYDNTGVLAELNSRDSEDIERSKCHSKATVMRLDKSDMGLYGLRPETDPFNAVVCSICNAIVKPQGLQKHMVNRHNAHHHANINHNYHTTSSHHSATNCSLLSSSISGQFDRSSEHHFLSQTISSSSSSVGVSTGIGIAGTAFLSNSTSNAASNFISSGSSYSSGSRSKSRSTSKIKAKSGKSSSPSSSSNHHVSSSNISSTTAASSSSATLSFSVSSGSSVQRNVHNASNSTPAGHSSSSGSVNNISNRSFEFGANTPEKNSNYLQAVAITATNSTSHSASSSGRAGHKSVQKTDSNPKQIKPPLTGDSCLSSLSNAPQHMQSQGGNSTKGTVIPTLSEASLSSIPEFSGSSSGSSTASSNSSISSNSSSGSLAISSSSSSLSSSSLSGTTRRTYGRSSKTITSERKNLPVKDREYDADKHCGVLAGDPLKPCTRSLTCKSHTLTMRRLVNGRTKSFDKLLSDHRTTKESTRSSSNSVSRAIPEFESSNSSSSIEMDRRSSQSVSSNSNLSTEAQPHSSSSSMSPIPPMTSASGSDGTLSAGIASISSSNQNSGHSFGGSTRRVVSSMESHRSHGSSSSSSSVDIREVTETVRSTNGKLQLSLSRVDCPRDVEERGSSVRSTGSSFATNRRRGVSADNNDNFLITTRMIETERSAIPPELLDDRNFQLSVFSPESTVLKRPIRLLVDEDPEEYKRARKSKIKERNKRTKNKYQFRALNEPSQYALSMPPAASAVAKLFVQNNPKATVTNAQFVLDPETNIVSVNMHGIFDPKDLRVNWSRLERKFLEKTIIDSMKPYGVTADEKGHLVIPKCEFYIPNPEDEGFRIHHHKQMTEGEYARPRSEFINEMPKPIRCEFAQGGVKTEIKDERDPIDTSHLPSILSDLQKDLRNVKMETKQEIKQEIKYESMNEDEMLEYCQPANCLKISENYNEMSNEIASIDPISFQVPTIETRTAITEQKSQLDLLPGEIIHGFSQNNSPEYRERDNELPNLRTVRNMLGHRPTDRELLASADEISSNYTVTSNEISINIPLFEMSTEGISNAISTITAIEIPKIISEQDSNISEVVHHHSKPTQEIRRHIAGQITEIIKELDPILMENVTPSSPALPAPGIPEKQQQPQPQQPPVEPMSVMTAEDEELAYDKDSSFLGVVETISTSNSKCDQMFSSQQEKENTKILMGSNFYDIYPFSDDVLHGLKTWHTSPPKPLSVNTFGLVKIRGGTSFKKNVVTMRKTKSSIQSYHYMKKSNAILFRREKQNDCIRSDMNSAMNNGNLNQMGNIMKYNIINRSKRNIGNHNDELLLWALRMQLEEQLEEQLDENLSGSHTVFKQCNTMNGSRPRLEKKSIIMHKVHMNKTCKALRSNIVGKLSEQLLGFKKYNHSGRSTSAAVNISGAIGVNQQTYGNVNGRCCGSSSKSINANPNSTTSRSSHSEGSSSKVKNRSSNGSNSRSNGGSSSGNSVFLGTSAQQQHIGGGNTTKHYSAALVRYVNANVLNRFRVQSGGITASSSSSSTTSGSISKSINNGNSTSLTSIGQPSSSISSLSRSVLSNHHRNGTEYN